MMWYAGSDTATLVPSGSLSICSGRLFTLRCETIEPFQQWNITVPQFGFYEVRQVTAYGLPEITPLRSHYMIFSFTRETESPLVVSLEVINATINFRISCVEYTGSIVTSVGPSLTATVNIIKLRDIHGKSHEINVAG